MTLDTDVTATLSATAAVAATDEVVTAPAVPIGQPPRPQAPVVQVHPAVDNGQRLMITRSRHGVPLKRPNKELPTPMASTATPAPKRVQLNQSMKFCLDIIRELLTKKHRDYAWPFYDPVSIEHYPDYRDIVKKPIDLNTIKTKIETGQYKTVKPFVKDMRLMFTNCLRYNKPDAPVIEQARKLRDFFEYRYSRIPEEYLTEKMTTNSNQNGHQSHHKCSDEHNSNSRHKDKSDTNVEMDFEGKRMKLLETQVKLLSTTISALTGSDSRPSKTKNGSHKKSSSNSRPKRPKPSPKNSKNNSHNNHKRQKGHYMSNGHHVTQNDDYDDEDDSDDRVDEQLVPSPIVFDVNNLDDLQTLKTDLENLDAKDLKNVLRILQSTEPSIKCDNDENIEIDFEALKPETLIALRKFVSSCMLNSKPKKNRSSLNGSDSSKKKSNCDMNNGYNVSSNAGADPSMNLSDSSNDSESEESSSSDSEDD